MTLYLFLNLISEIIAAKIQKLYLIEKARNFEPPERFGLYDFIIIFISSDEKACLIWLVNSNKLFKFLILKACITDVIHM